MSVGLSWRTRPVIARALAAFSRPLALSLGLAVAAPRVTHAQRPSDLPLNEIVSTGRSNLFAVILTGDGGWAALDAGVAKSLVNAGVSVVGWNQRSYLWSRKTPDQAGTDLGRIIEFYRREWKRDSVLVIGYSRGAGTAPFAINRLDAGIRARIAGVVLIGAEHGAGFEFRLSDVMRNRSAADDLPVAPEILRLDVRPLLCVYGADEPDTICPEFSTLAVLLKLKGGHHYDGAYPQIGEFVVKRLVKP